MKKIPTELRVKTLRFLREILIVTVGILIAFRLNVWRDASNARTQEQKILKELKANLTLDLIDLNENRRAHEWSIKELDTLQKFSTYQLSKEKVASIVLTGFRDYVFVPQTSAFETLKSKGVDMIANDSLRISILRLYDFHYTFLVYLEAEYGTSQFHPDMQYLQETYFSRFFFSPDSVIVTTRSGDLNWVGNSDVQVRIDRTIMERRFALKQYDLIISNVTNLINRIDTELE